MRYRVAVTALALFGIIPPAKAQLGVSGAQLGQKMLFDLLDGQTFVYQGSQPPVTGNVRVLPDEACTTRYTLNLPSRQENGVTKPPSVFGTISIDWRRVSAAEADPSFPDHILLAGAGGPPGIFVADGTSAKVLEAASILVRACYRASPQARTALAGAPLTVEEAARRFGEDTARRWGPDYARSRPEYSADPCQSLFTVGRDHWDRWTPQTKTTSLRVNWRDADKPPVLDSAKFTVTFEQPPKGPISLGFNDLAGAKYFYDAVATLIAQCKGTAAAPVHAGVTPPQGTAILGREITVDASMVTHDTEDFFQNYWYTRTVAGRKGDRFRFEWSGSLPLDFRHDFSTTTLEYPPGQSIFSLTASAVLTLKEDGEAKFEFGEVGTASAPQPAETTLPRFEGMRSRPFAPFRLRVTKLN